MILERQLFLNKALIHITITFSYLVGANLLNMQQSMQGTVIFNPLNAELNPICHLLALLAHRILHVSRIRVKYLSHITWPLHICYATKFIKINTSLWLVDCTFAICHEKCEVQTISHQNMSLQDAKFPPHPIHLPRGGARLLGNRRPTVLVSIMISASGSKCARKYIDHSWLDHHGVSGTSYPVTGRHSQEWTILLRDCLLP